MTFIEKFPNKTQNTKRKCFLADLKTFPVMRVQTQPSLGKLKYKSKFPSFFQSLKRDWQP
jgi:hypothetical protein